MKQIYITLVTLFFSATFLAQGIAVQGIARDDEKAALPQKQLNFTFKIISNSGTERYTEDASIRTDNFGVFSHIMGAGNRFDNVDFSEQDLKIRVSIKYPTDIIVYEEGFNYTPYAHYAKKATDADNATNAISAENGVPTGSIMPFMGTTAPEGWLMCDGSEIPTEYTTLRAMFSNNRTPNLKGRFLKGAGTGGGHNALVTSQFDETTLGEYQTQSMQDHRHNDGDLTTSSEGSHSHDVAVIYANTETRTVNITNPSTAGNYYFVTGSTSYDHNITAVRSSVGSATRIKDSNGNNIRGQAFIQSTGNHAHTITGNTGNAIQKSGAASTQPLFVRTEETKPNNFSVNYIIKL